MFRHVFVLMVVLATAGAAPAASWADALFNDLSRDFGSVPRGTLQTHAFHLTNRTGSPLHIASVRVSCGCVSAQAARTDVASGKGTDILAQMDTGRFFGSKTVTIFVQFDQPQWEEVRLWVHANSREDMTLNPETLAFGRVRHGKAAQAQLEVAMGGGSGWRILEARSDTNYITPKVNELRRDAGGIAYQVAARLRSDAPAGKWYTEIWLKTNDPSSPQLRIPVTVEIEPTLTVSPSSAALGQVKAGEEAERKIIVRGEVPFRITGVDGTDALVSVRDTTKGSNPVHVLAVKVKGLRPGELTRELRIRTDMKDEGTVNFLARAEVVP